MKILVFGAGAIGSIIGGLLAEAGENVVLVGRRKHVEKINRDGLKIDGVPGKLNIKVAATTKLPVDFKPDLILLTVKTQDLIEAAETIQHYKDVPVITIQNGIRADELAAEILGRENIIGCAAYMSVEYLEPGMIRCVRKGNLVMGTAFGENEKEVEKVAKTLNKAIPTRITNNIYGARWTKLSLNLVLNGLSAISGLSLAQHADYPFLCRIAALLWKEGLGVIGAAKIQLEPIPPLPINVLGIIRRMPTPLLTKTLQQIFKKQNYLPSTLQSIIRGKKTEIDYLNGEIVKLGKVVNIPTPYNETVVNLTKEVEKEQRFYAETELRVIFDKIENPDW